MRGAWWRTAAMGLSLWGMLTVVPARGDLFDEARRAIPIEVGRADSTGVSLRGGAPLASGQSPTSATLFRTQATIGGGCGAFDFVQSLEDAFQEVPDLFQQAGEAILANLPMLVLCYSSPTVCDQLKHYQALVNAVLQARFANCHQIQAAAQYGGLRLRGGEVSRCLERESNAGRTVSQAMKTCNAGISSLRLPTGENGPEVNLVKDTLAAFGASEETHQLARNLLGEITLRADGALLGAEHQKPKAALLKRYEGHRQDFDGALRRAMDEMRETGTVSEATLRAISVPGQPIPRAAVVALLALQRDPTRLASMTGKLSGALAITQLTWECQELQEQLATAVESNTNLTTEERLLLQRRYESLQRDLAAVMQKTDVVEKRLQPAIDALLSEYTAVQAVATQAGITAPTLTVPRMPYGTQTPSGYGQ